MAKRGAEETRQLLVGAAIEGLRELSVADLLTAVGTREVARRAGVSPATLFHHFGSVEVFAQAVLERVYDPGTSPVSGINDKLGGLVEAELPIEAGLALHRSQFYRVLEDREHRLRVGLWAFGGDASRAAYGDYVRVSDGHLLDQHTRLFDSWRREVRPPFDVAMLVAAQAALLSGAVIRHTTDPEATDAERFAQVAAALTMVMLRTPEDGRDFDDRLAEINYYPLGRGTRSTSERARSSRDRILDAAAELWTRQPYEETSLAQVARAAGFGVTTAYALVVSKTDLAVAVLVREGRHLGVEHDSLEGALLAVADLVAVRAAYAGPYVTRLAVGQRTAEHDPLLAAVAAGLDTAQRQGALRPEVEVAEVAPTVLLVLAGRALADPSEGAAGAVRHVLDVVVGGLAT